MANLKVDSDKPDIKKIVQFRIPRVNSPGDAEIVGVNFTSDFKVTVYVVDDNDDYVEIGTVSEEYFDTSKSVSFTLSIDASVAAGCDKIVGIKCGEFEEVFSEPKHDDEKFCTE